MPTSPSHASCMCAGELVQSLGGQPGSQDVYIALFSVFNAAGRLLFGHFSEELLHSRGVPRSAFMVAASCLSAAFALLTAFADLRVLYVCAMVGGLAYGFHFAIMPALCSEAFGLTHFGANYNLIQVRGHLDAGISCCLVA